MEPLFISTGRAADGKDKYFERLNVERKIWLKIKRKENLLLAAPRRTGKSSILKNIERNPQDGYLIKYKSVQSVDSGNEYFKQIYKILLEDDSIFKSYKRYFEKTKGAVKKFASRIRGLSIEGIEIDAKEQVDYYDELFDFFFETEEIITEKIIDKIINKIINDRYEYQDYFENWKTRLRQAFSATEYKCALEILNVISEKGSMGYDVLYDTGTKYKIDDLKDITNVLEYDGYLNKDKNKNYRFNSIILKEWWCLNVAN